MKPPAPQTKIVFLCDIAQYLFVKIVNEESSSLLIKLLHIQIRIVLNLLDVLELQVLLLQPNIVTIQ